MEVNGTDLDVASARRSVVVVRAMVQATGITRLRPAVIATREVAAPISRPTVAERAAEEILRIRGSTVLSARVIASAETEASARFLRLVVALPNAKAAIRSLLGFVSGGHP